MNKYLILTAIVVCACSTTIGAENRLRISNEGDIRERWMLADGVKLAAPGYPAKFAERGDNVCVAVGYAIQPDGTTSDFSLLKSWSSSTGEEEPSEGFWDAFAQASAGALSQWKFKPRPEVTAPDTTYTVATMQFMGKQATDGAALRAHCSIPDLAALIQKNKAYHYEKYGTPEQRALMKYQNAQRDSSMLENPSRGRRDGRLSGN